MPLVLTGVIIHDQITKQYEDISFAPNITVETGSQTVPFSVGVDFKVVKIISRFKFGIKF